MGNLLLDFSIIYRNIQKFLDQKLAVYNLGYAQLSILILIYENEGIKLGDISTKACIDKGTITKTISKLLEHNYIEIILDQHDKRIKHIYITTQGNEIMNDLYAIRNDCVKQLMGGLDNDESHSLIEDIAVNSKVFAEDEEAKFLIGGFSKLSLVDYPGKVASTVFTSGCNFKCPYCHNKDLVFVPENTQYLAQEDILLFLKKRQGIIDAVCITGGEPLLQAGLINFIKEVKEMGFLVKLDTNGNYPEKLQEVLNTGLIDFVAMDIKNSLEKYEQTVGLSANTLDLQRIIKSIDYLKKAKCTVEFRTTVALELHSAKDIESIAKMIGFDFPYVLQNYQESENVIEKRFSSFADYQLQQICTDLKKAGYNISIRGGI